MVAVFAGRHIPEKRVPALVPALAEARRQIPDLRGEIYGDGPERTKVLQAIAESGLEGRSQRRASWMRRCSQKPSQAPCVSSFRLGARATASSSSKLLRAGCRSSSSQGPDNAAVELVEDGTNGAIAPSVDPRDLAAAIVRVYEGGTELRDSAAQWFSRNAERLSFERSFERVQEAYGAA